MIEHYFQRRLTRAEADHVKDIFKREWASLALVCVHIIGLHPPSLQWVGRVTLAIALLMDLSV